MLVQDLQRKLKISRGIIYYRMNRALQGEKKQATMPENRKVLLKFSEKVL